MKDIIFFSTVEGVSDVCPITPAIKSLPVWTNVAKEKYIKEKNDSNERVSHLYQCPGIFDLYNYGYIVTAWHDFIIKTDQNKQGFAWTIPHSDLADLMKGIDIIGTHQQRISELIPSRPTSIKQVIKLNTPWHVIAPKGIKFIVLPIAYPDSFEFDSHIGILDPAVSSEINVQLNWNIKDGETLIKAGTPLAHLIPISEDKFNLICRDATDNDKRWLRKRNFFNNFTFKLKRNVIKEFYYKHFYGI
jgi:hypothetical protein